MAARTHDETKSETKSEAKSEEKSETKREEKSEAKSKDRKEKGLSFSPLRFSDSLLGDDIRGYKIVDQEGYGHGSKCMYEPEHTYVHVGSVSLYNGWHCVLDPLDLYHPPWHLFDHLKDTMKHKQPLRFIEVSLPNTRGREIASCIDRIIIVSNVMRVVREISSTEWNTYINGWREYETFNGSAIITIRGGYNIYERGDGCKKAKSYSPDISSRVFSQPCQAHYSQGLLHQDDSDVPSVKWNNGDKEYFVLGKRHREEKHGPAIEYANGDYVYMRENQIHRDSAKGPALRWSIPNSKKIEYRENGKLHRIGDYAREIVSTNEVVKEWRYSGELYNNKGPAIVRTQGVIREWYGYVGIRHRADGLPAWEHQDGSQKYIEGGELHRDKDLPAWTTPTSDKWYWRGKLHRPREKGPAVIYHGDIQRMEFWENGNRIPAPTPQGELPSLVADPKKNYQRMALILGGFFCVSLMVTIGFSRPARR